LQAWADIIIIADMARLVILSEGLGGQAHELKVDKTTIGRVDDNTFPVPEASVSSHHCEILLRGGDIVVRDLNSTNGTFINGHQVTGEAPLKNGQILRLGQVELRLEDGAAGGAPPSPSVEAAPKPAPAAKKLPDQTMVIPQGVKLGQEPSTTVTFNKSAFAKKSNMGTKIFIGVIVLVGIAVVVLLVVVARRSGLF
jgi:predicted component of type VI protein secretion system